MFVNIQDMIQEHKKRCDEHIEECIESGEFVQFTEDDFKSKLAESPTKGQ